ncbi:MAG: DNA polymerase III subunit gamma/tau [Acholeplasmatales bacterium]
MAYRALYRTYRPKQFKEVVGQEVIVKTLQNALKLNKIAHAYLFSGPRGTGKTSIAKILAKAVNCELSPTNEPCGTCQTCRLIEQGHISDVIEMDAASNRGINEIRDLIEKSNYLPSTGRYKVYIIDEVHMLTKEAFNALLKILEEPPAHVIFILATTEINQLLPTIISRCQTFDFRGISLKHIEERLFEIKVAEHINISDEAIKEIARLSDGGLRDAISLLDQTVSFSTGNVTLDDVYKVSGSVSRTNLMNLLNFILEKKTAEAFSLVDDIIEDGKEVPKIISDMIAILRDALVEKNVAFDIERSTKDLKDLAKRFSNDRFFFYLDILAQAQHDTRWTNQKRAYLDLAIIKMIDHKQLDKIVEYEQTALMMNKINALELEFSKFKEIPPQIIKVEEKKNGTEKPLEEVKEEVLKDNVEKIKEEEFKKEITVEQIENILNNGNINKKNNLLKHWDSLLNISNQSLQTIAEILHQGELVAASDSELLLVYPDKTTCILMLQEENKQAALKVFNSKQKLVDNYICIDKLSWDILFNEFKKQWASGNKKPTLPKIDLEIYESNEEPWQSDTLKLALDFFGDIVKTKEN